MSSGTRIPFLVSLLIALTPSLALAADGDNCSLGDDGRIGVISAGKCVEVATVPTPIPVSKEVADSDGKCEPANDTAVKACTTQDMSAGMNPQQAQQAQQMSQQAGAANNAVGASGGSGSQCNNQALLSGLLSGLSALKGTACSSSVSNCKKKCEQEAQLKDAQMQPQEAKRLRGLGDACKGLASNSGAAFAQAAGLIANMFQNLQCAHDSQATASPTPPPDCTNPEYAKTNMLCICQNDPKSAMCTTQQPFSDSVSATNSTGPGTPGFGGDDDMGMDGQVVSGAQAKPDTARGSAGAAGGGGGGPSGGGGGGPGNLGGGGDDYGRSNVDKNVITGTSGGGGGGGGGGGIGGGGGGGGAKAGGGGGDDKPFDLSKFLPGAKQRGLAGMSISAKDGVTGPMGPSIWEKVSNQYNQQKQGMFQSK